MGAAPDPIDIQRLRDGVGRQLRVAVEAARTFADGLEDTLPGIARGPRDGDTAAALRELADTLAQAADSCASLARELQAQAEALRDLAGPAPQEQTDA